MKKFGSRSFPEDLMPRANLMPTRLITRDTGLCWGVVIDEQAASVSPSVYPCNQKLYAAERRVQHGEIYSCGRLNRGRMEIQNGLGT
jgi:hypothetical protein